MATQAYNTAVIKNKATEINTQNGELRKIITDLEGIVEAMSSVWKDSAQTQFVKQFNNMKPELDSFCNSIGSFAERAEQHALAVEKAEGVL